MAKEIPAALAATHRFPTDAEIASRKLRVELEDRLAQLTEQETAIAEERKRLETLLQFHPDAAAAEGLVFDEHEVGVLVKK